MKAFGCRFTRDYVHRVGRTARAGRGGLSISLVSQASDNVGIFFVMTIMLYDTG